MTASRSWPDHAGLPCRVQTTDRAKSYVKTATCPDPTEARLTAGDDVGEVALEYSVATGAAPARLYRSAGPWNWMVSATIPTPGLLVVLTARYASLRTFVVAERPDKEASCL